MNQRDINEKKLFERFHVEELQATQDVWKTILEKLDEKDKKKRRPIFLFWFAGVFLIIIGFLTIDNISDVKLKPGLKINNDIIKNGFQKSDFSTAKARKNNEYRMITSKNEDREMNSLVEIKNQNMVLDDTNNYHNSINEGWKPGSVPHLLASKRNEHNEKVLSTTSSNDQQNNSHPLLLHSPLTVNPGSVDPLNVLDHPFLSQSILKSPNFISSKSIASLATDEMSIKSLNYKQNNLLSHRKKIEKYMELSSGLGFPFKHISSNSTETQVIQNKTSTETPLYYWNSNVLIGVQILESWSISTGVQIVQIKEKFDYSFSKASQLEVKIDPTTQIPVDTFLVHGTIIEKSGNTITLINIPVNIGYKKKIGAWKVGMNGGIGINVYMAAKGKILVAEQDIQSVSSIPALYKKTIGLNGRFSLSFERKISKNLSFKIEPQYVRYISDWTLSNQINLSYDLIGLQVGLIKSF